MAKDIFNAASGGNGSSVASLAESGDVAGMVSHLQTTTNQTLAACGKCVGETGK